MIRVGSGFDVHAFTVDGDRPLVLGGVRVDGAPGLDGHSDGDVVAHAFADAILGASTLGDLGAFFGVDDPARARADSIELLREVVEAARSAGLSVSNADCTVVAERPRLAGERDRMRLRLAQALAVEVDQVSVKVTSTDGLGAIGRGEGIACWATVLLAGE